MKLLIPKKVITREQAKAMGYTEEMPTEQEMRDSMEFVFKCSGMPNQTMRISRWAHRALFPDQYPDYWPSAETLFRLEKRLGQ